MISLNAGQKYYRMHSAILSTFIKLPKKNAPIVLLYDTVSLFLVLFKYFHIYKLTQVRCSYYPSALSLGRLFQQSTSQISAILMR